MSLIDRLQTDNLVPIYLLDEKLRKNFQEIQKWADQTDEVVLRHFNEQQSHNSKLEKHIAIINDTLAGLQPLVERRVEEKIMTTLGMVISNKINEYYQQSITNEASIMRIVQEKVSKLSKQLKSDLKVQITRETDSMLSNQLSDFRRTIKASVNSRPISTVAVPAGQIDKSIGIKLEQLEEELQDAKKKLEKVSELSQSLEKESYDTQTENAEKFRALLETLEDYKAFNNKNIQNFKIDFFKLKNNKAAMEGIKMDKLDQIFKDNIKTSLDELSKSLGGTLTKTQFEQLFFKGIEKNISESQDEIKLIRRELVRLNQTIAYTNQLSQGLEGFETKLNERFISLQDSINNNDKAARTQFAGVKQTILQMKVRDEQLNKVDQQLSSKIEQQKLDLMKLPIAFDQLKSHKTRIVQLERICSYEEHMDEIHDVLDQQFLVKPEGEQKTIFKKKKNINDQKIIEIQRNLNMLDQRTKVDIEEIRLLQAKKNQLHQLWKAVNILQTRIELLKGDDQAAIAAKKQWTCLSCQKNIDLNTSRQGIQHKNWDAVPLKKLEPIKSGGFGQKQLSSKNLKVIPPEEKPEKIERVREKYFSDTVKLPDILQQRLQGTKQFKLI